MAMLVVHDASRHGTTIPNRKTNSSRQAARRARPGCGARSGPQGQCARQKLADARQALQTQPNTHRRDSVADRDPFGGQRCRAAASRDMTKAARLIGYRQAVRGAVPMLLSARCWPYVGNAGDRSCIRLRQCSSADPGQGSVQSAHEYPPRAPARPPRVADRDPAEGNAAWLCITRHDPRPQDTSATARRCAGQCPC